MDKKLEKYILTKEEDQSFLRVFDGIRPLQSHVDIQIAGPGSALLIVLDASVTRETWDVALQNLIRDKIPGFSIWDSINPMKASALMEVKRTAEKLSSALKTGKPNYLIDQYIDLDSLEKVYPEGCDSYTTLMDHRLEISEFLKAFFAFFLQDKGLESLDCMLNFSFS